MSNDCRLYGRTLEAITMKITTAASVFLAFSAPFGVEAFLPVGPTGTKLAAQSRIAFVSSPHPTVSGAAPTPTTLAMGGNFVDRFVRVFNSNVNKIISGLEDPEKVIIQAVEDMQNDLVKVRQAYAETTATQRRLQRQKEQVDAEGDCWYARAELALRRGKEVLAREALSRRQVFVDKAHGLEDQLNTQRVASDKLYEAMMALETKIKQASGKKQQLISRAKTAKSIQQVNEMLSGLGAGKTSMSAFVRMEEKVEALEAAAEASADMTVIPDSTMELEFRLLEQSFEVDNELRKMKSDLKLMLSPSSKQVSNSVDTVQDDQHVSVPVSVRDRI